MPPSIGRQLQQQLRAFFGFYLVTYNDVFAISTSTTATTSTSTTTSTHTETYYMRMTPEFFEMIKTRLEPRLARQATNYRVPISVEEKSALTIRYLATGESYTSLSCHFRVGRSTISKVCRAIQDEFTREYLRCPTTPDELEREFRIRWNVPHALGALDGKHVAVKKPKNTGALYHNYNGFFSINSNVGPGRWTVQVSDGWMLVQLDLAQMPRYLMPLS